MANDTPNAPLVTGDITFLQFFDPPMMAGDYTFTVTQTLTSVQDGVIPSGTVYQDHHSFNVRGERFRIDPAEVQSVYPPANNVGEYFNSLPHLVLTQHTLPWQREPVTVAHTDPPPAGQVPPNKRSFLAVLLFQEDDPPPAPANMTLHDLLPASLPDGVVSYANLVLEPGENPTDPCQVLDIPVDLFSALVPSGNDLFSVAHGRQLTAENVNRKSIVAGATVPPPNSYAVVVCNRIPAAGKRCVAHLVCLEHMGDYLPGDDGTPATSLQNKTKVRLASLFSWTFATLDQKMTFTDYLEGLTDQAPPSSLQLPVNHVPEGAPALVTQALIMGYCANNHHTRMGDQTVSWYRGPLAPYGVTSDLTPMPAASADTLYRYDPATGLFDISYAAAWQLGRLLALHDPAFSSSLYVWKRLNTQSAILAAEQQIWANRWQVSLDNLTLDNRPALQQKVMDQVQRLTEKLS